MVLGAKDFLDTLRDVDGVIQWPANESDKGELAAEVLGACIIQANDYWIAHELEALMAMPDVAQNPVIQRAIHRALLQFSRGSIFSALSKLDDEGATVILNDYAKVSREIVLHERFYFWVNPFSEYLLNTD